MMMEQKRKQRMLKRLLSTPVTVVNLVMKSTMTMNRKQRRAQQKQDNKKKKVESNVRNVISKVDEQRIIDKTLQQYEDKYAEALTKGVNYTTHAMLAVLAVTLHDKWGWGQKRTKRLFAQINETFSTVKGGYVKIEELIEVVYDELGIDLK